MPFREKSQRGASQGGKIASVQVARPGLPATAIESSAKAIAAKQIQPKRKLQAGAFAQISRRAADRLRGGHLWVYRSDIEKLAAPDAASQLIAVVDPRGALLGTALYSADSQIAARLVSTGILNEAGWIALFRERLQAAFRFRGLEGVGPQNGTDACRLVFSEADLLPGLIADKYNDLVVLQTLTQGMDSPAIRQAFIEVARDEIAPRAILQRTDSRLLELEGLATAGSSPLYVTEGCDAALDLASTIFHLNGLSFHYNADSGQKTGAFLDQRENYAAAARHCRGEALDVCAYHGGFALHLARKCRRVTGVDASRAALEVAELNFDLNRSRLAVPEIEWVEANAFDLLRDWSASGSRFDAIVLDPPAFAKSKRAAEGALRGYKELNLRALKMLRPGGTLVTCSCSHHVGIEDFTAIVAAAAGDAGRTARLIERRGAAADHPVLLTVPETEYLKSLICQVG